MRVLHVTPTYAPALGGIETVVADLCRESRARGIDAAVAHVATQWRELESEVIGGITVWRVPLRGHRLIGWAPALGGIARDFDVLHVHDPQLMAISANVRRYGGRRPAVLSTHGGYRHTRRLRLAKSFHERFVLPNALRAYRCVLASSATDLTHFSRFGSNVVLAQNGISVDRFGSIERTRAATGLRWIYWGRLSVNKRVDQAIELAGLAHKMGYDVDLLICGEDFDAIGQSLRARISELGLGERVRIAGAVDNAALVRELADRQVFVTGSEYEGFGVGVIEAMSAGLAVVCRDIPPLNGLVDDGRTGLLARFDRSEHDRSVLRRLLDDPASAARLGGQARAEAAAHGWAAAIGPVLASYGTALDGKMQPT